MSGAPLPVLEDHFTPGEPLGEGGFGAVRIGHPRRGGPEVAIKVAHADLAPTLVPRIRREASLARGLAHPGLVGFHGLFQDREGRLALVYERVRGKTLRGEPSPPPGREEVLTWTQDLAGALDALHAAGLVHRDVKAENVLVEASGHARLLDFGLLRATEEGATLTQEGILLGTPVIMAPELFRAEPATPASDRYALACLVFAQLTGRYPLRGNPAELFRLHLHDPTGSLQEALAPLPSALRSCLNQALSVPPSGRFPSCQAFALALGEALEDPVSPGASPREPGATRIRSTPLPPPGPAPTQAISPRPGPLPTFGRPLLLGLLAGVALVTGALLPGGSPAPDPPPRPPPPSSVPPPGARGEALAAPLLAELEGLYGRKLAADGSLLPEGTENGEAPFVLTEDLSRWHRLRPHMPAYRAFLGTLLEDLDLAELPPEDRQALARVDSWGPANDLHLPELVGQFLEPAPREQPDLWLREDVDSPELRRRRNELTGWPTEAVFHYLEALAHLRRYQEEFRIAMETGEAPSAFPDFGETRSLMAFTDFKGFVTRSEKFQSYRLARRAWFADGIRSTRRFLVAAGRSLEPDFPLRSELGRFLSFRCLRKIRAFLAAAMTLQGVPGCLSRHPGTPEAHFFAAHLIHFWNDRRLPEMPYQGRAFEEACLEAIPQDHWGHRASRDQTDP